MRLKRFCWAGEVPLVSHARATVSSFVSRKQIIPSSSFPLPSPEMVLPTAEVGHPNDVDAPTSSSEGASDTPNHSLRGEGYLWSSSLQYQGEWSRACSQFLPLRGSSWCCCCVYNSVRRFASQVSASAPSIRHPWTASTISAPYGWKSSSASWRHFLISLP